MPFKKIKKAIKKVKNEPKKALSAVFNVARKSSYDAKKNEIEILKTQLAQKPETTIICDNPQTVQTVERERERERERAY
jgi:hypothetical protein